MYSVLGPVEVGAPGGPPALGGPKQRALLGVLLLHANRVVSTDRLIEALWGPEAPLTALNVLQGHVADLRRLLPRPAALRTRAPGYVLEVDPEDVDAQRFERLAREGRAALGDDPALAAARLREALSLWRGPVLADAAYPSPPPEIRRLEALRLAALEDRIDADLALGGHPDLVGELEALVAEHPGQERLCGQLMLALYRRGRQADALAACRDLRARLADELGIDPSPDLRRLERSILRQDPSLLPPGAEVVPASDAEAPAPDPAAPRPARVPVIAAAALVLVTLSSVGVLRGRSETPASPPPACAPASHLPAPRSLGPGEGVLAHVANSCDENSSGVWPRSGPSRDTPRVPPAYGEGTPIRIVCQDRTGGLVIDNRLGAPPAPPSRVWDRLDDGSWLSDIYTTLPRRTGEVPPLGLPVC